MPSPRNGNAGSLVSPAAPRAALDADRADPGEVEKAKAVQVNTGSGKYGSVPVKPHVPGKDSDQSKKTVWIEIELVDKRGKPVPGEAYRVTLPDGTAAEGTLDGKGFARVDGIDPGSCKITFPELEKQAWKRL